jgi:trans-aconitate 2-methyltransferase
VSDPTAWQPDQYLRFGAERSWPFYDLLAMLRPAERPLVVDLGCGTGALTQQLHMRMDAAETVGIDHSPAMLEQAAPLAGGGLRFEEGDIAAFEGGGYDIVFSNAALHWLPDHPAVLRRWADALAPGGQIAVQLPANSDHPATLLGAELALEPPFLDAFGGSPPPEPTRANLDPAGYAQLLYDLGFAEQHVRLQVYGHVLASTAEVVEWAKGTGLTRLKGPLGPELYDRFVERYRERLIETLGWHEPYFYTFKRILFWGRGEG